MRNKKKNTGNTPTPIHQAQNTTGQVPESETEKKIEARTRRHLNWVSGISLAAFAAVILFSIIAGIAVKKEWVGGGQGLDLLFKAILPTAGAAIVAFLAFFGYGRFKDFDERQAAMKKELDERQAEMKRELIEEVPKSMTVNLTELQEAIKQERENLDQQSSEIHEKLDDIFAKAPWLREFGPDHTNWSQMKSNVQWVHDFVQRLLEDMSNNMSASANAATFEMIQGVIDAVCEENSNINGDPDDYHNLSSELARNNQLGMAVRVLEKGLSLFRHNTDIIAGILLHAAKLGQAKPEVEAVLLKEIPVEQWNWRAFTFYIDALNLRHSTPEQFSETMTYVEHYIRVHPTEERARFAKFETLERYGHLEKAKQALIDAQKELKMTAQCSFRLAQILKMEGRFEEAIYAANRAVISEAESQPSSPIAVAVAERGFARDALILRDIADGVRTRQECAEDITLVLQDYDLAKKLCYHSTGMRTVLKRIDLMKSLLESDSARTDGDDDDGDDDTAKKILFKRLLSLLDGDQEKFSALLEGLRSLSPITEKKQVKFNELIECAVEGNMSKAAEVKQILSKLFGGEE